LGEEVVQGPLVRPANVHARPLSHGLQSLKDLDILGGVAAALRRGWGWGLRRDWRRLRHADRPGFRLGIIKQ
ncbi:MAG: hypothetical protein ACKO01_11600, partial [Erythrobacter sp.]